MASSFTRIEGYGVDAISKVTDGYTIRHAKFHSLRAGDWRPADRYDPQRGKEEKGSGFRLLPACPLLGARLLCHGRLQWQRGGVRSGPQSGLRRPRTVAARERLARSAELRRQSG